MKHLRYTIPGPPRPLKRHGFAHGHAYDPQQNKEQKSQVGTWAFQAMRAKRYFEPFPCDVAVTLEFYLERPQRTKFMRPRRGDVDNYCKLVLDGMNGIVYQDDNQVTDLHAMKRWDESGCPRTVVIVEEM